MTTLLPCPNPECRSSDLKQYSLNMHSGPSWWVTCEACKLCGPSAANDTEAIRLWNALPREEPWIAIDEKLAKRDEDGFLVANLFGLDVAFADGTTEALVDLDLDYRGWHATTDEGRPVGGHEDDRKVATHYRKHVPPRHPLETK